MHKDTNAVDAVNVSLTQKPYTASVVVNTYDVSQRDKQHTNNPTNMDVPQSGQSKENVQESKEAYLIRISEEQWQPPPPKPSKKAPYYSFSFQCWNCLHLHSGIIQSDNQLLELQCDSLLDFEFDPLFNIMGKPRVCGRVNHVYGRRTKQKDRRKTR